MTPEQFSALVRAKQKEIRECIHNQLPKQIGRIAADHYKENFRRGGFVNGGLHPWKKTRRQLMGGSAAFFRNGPLLSGRNNLYGSIGYTPGDAHVVVGTTGAPYASVHNEGAVIPVTPKMRGKMWANYYAEMGAQKGSKGKKKETEKAKMWKAMALGLKKRSSITIPQRQFLGPSQELNVKIQTKIETELTKIINS